MRHASSRRLLPLLGLLPRLLPKGLLVHLVGRLPYLTLLLGRLDADLGVRLARLGRAPHLLFSLLPRGGVALNLVPDQFC